MRSVNRITVAIATILTLTGSLFAADLHWDGGGTGDNWATAANWNPDQQPTAGDNAYINDDATVDLTYPNEMCSNLYLGTTKTETGTIDMSSGSLLTGSNEFIGGFGTGHFRQTGGTHSVTGNITLGQEISGVGTYSLSGGTLTVSGDITKGTGESRLTIDGGTLDVAGGSIDVDYLRLGYNIKSTGTYDLETGTQLSTVDQSIGVAGTGILTQTGGSNTVDNELYLGMSSIVAAGDGTYNLQGGSLTADTIHVGSTYASNKGVGELNWTGGTLGTKTINVDTEGTMTIGQDWQNKGALNIQGGSVDLGTNRLTISHGVGAGASASLSDNGELSARVEYIGYEPGMSSGKGTFTQSSGTNTIGDALIIAYYSDDEGTYNLSGGTLSTETVHVGYNGTGALNITGAGADITFSDLLSFGRKGAFTAVPGSTIHMTGADFENHRGKIPADLAGLSNLTLVFEGGAADTSLFEVAGAEDGGFINNYALGSLTLGGADVGLLQLVDNVANSFPVDESECLFLHDLTIGTGSSLDVNGLLLYVEGDVESVLDGWIADGRIFDGTGISLNAVYDMAQDWTCVVPEPASLSLLAVGSFILLRRKR